MVILEDEVESHFWHIESDASRHLIDACPSKTDAVQLKGKGERGGDKSGSKLQFQKPSTFAWVSNSCL